MRIVLLCSTQANQVALANKIAASFNLVGIVAETKEKNKAQKLTLQKLVNAVIQKTIFEKINRAWRGTMEFYRNRYKNFPETKILQTKSINSLEVSDFISACGAELVMVSGTSMIKKNILSVPLSAGMINLHTGLSPYVKGAPNCTNWCIANNEYHLIGNSIMWIDAGIDSGDLLATAVVKFTGEEDLTRIHIKVMEEAHHLYLEAVHSIISSKAGRIRQNSIAEGKTYFSRQWNLKMQLKLLRNLKRFSGEIHSEAYLQKSRNIITISPH
jgi:methionyl-tRNA formyltransferase